MLNQVGDTLTMLNHFQDALTITIKSVQICKIAHFSCFQHKLQELNGHLLPI